MDNELLRLLNRRARLAVQIGVLKRRAGLPVHNAERERDVLARACRANVGPLDERAVAEIFRRIVLLLAPPPRQTDERADKVSLAVRLRHRPGALYAALEPLARLGLDLLKIESRLVRDEPWQYRFYLDLRGAAGEPRVAAALAQLRRHAEELRVLGCYPSA